MPKKTAYSRGGVQRSKPKQKSFELVRPTSDENVLAATESAEEVDLVEGEKAEDRAEVESFESENAEPQTEEIKEAEPVGKRVGTQVKSSVPASVASPATSAAPKSAAARMAARRQTTQKPQRPAATLISAENYGYVRKDLIFILILAIVMVAIIIALHFILGA